MTASWPRLDPGLSRRKFSPADVIFPEALRDRSEYEAFRRAVDLPLMVNLNEFGTAAPLAHDELEDLGINPAVYPMTLMRLALGAAERGLDDILATGFQHASIPAMQTNRLYGLLGYVDYAAFDQGVFTGQ